MSRTRSYEAFDYKGMSKLTEQSCIPESNSTSEINGNVGDCVVEFIQGNLLLTDFVAPVAEVLDNVALSGQKVARKRRQNITR